MSALGHVAVGLAVGSAVGGHSTPTRYRTMAAGTALALLPDLDWILMRWGAAEFGSGSLSHRGALHSITFALITAAVVGLVWRGRMPVRLKAATFSGAQVASHLLLDLFSRTDLGVMLFWPFTQDRYLAAFTFLPVPPVGSDLLQAHGLLVLAMELVVFSPLYVYVGARELTIARPVGRR